MTNSCETTTSLSPDRPRVGSLALDLNQEILTYNDIARAFDNEANSMGIGSSVEDPLARSIVLFGDIFTTQLVQSINDFIARNRAYIDASSLTTIKGKFGAAAKGIMSSHEALSFLDVNAFPVQNFTAFANANLVLVFDQLESFYGPSFAERFIKGDSNALSFTYPQGGEHFSGENFVNTFSNRAGSEVGSFPDPNSQTRILKMRENVFKVFDAVFEKERKTIESFRLSHAGNDTYPVDVLRTALTEKEKLLQELSPERMEGFKKSFDAYLAYSISLYEQKTENVGEFLAKRFAGVGESFEEYYQQSRKNLQSVYQTIGTSYKKVKATSERASAEAANNGALRYNDAERKARIAQMRSVMQRYSPNTPSLSPITENETFGMTTWNNGKGDDRVRFDGLDDRKQWEGLSLEARVYLMRTQQLFGKRLVLQRGFDKTNGESLHASGIAMDITWENFNRADMFVFADMAKKNGFRGFGISNKYIHIDLGPAREWNV